MVILGVIATFTIPKVLQSQQSTQKNAEAKEVASMISGSFQSLKLNQGISSTTSINVLTPYMNYVAVNTTGLIDDAVYGTSLDCSAGGAYCLNLHDGGVMYIRGWLTFGGTAATNALFFTFDPDASYSNSTTGDGKAVQFFIYTNGQIESGSGVLPNTLSGGGSYSTQTDPPWFSWS